MTLLLLLTTQAYAIVDFFNRDYRETVQCRPLAININIQCLQNKLTKTGGMYILPHTGTITMSKKSCDLLSLKNNQKIMGGNIKELKTKLLKKSSNTKLIFAACRFTHELVHAQDFAHKEFCKREKRFLYEPRAFAEERKCLLQHGQRKSNQFQFVSQILKATNCIFKASQSTKGHGVKEEDCLKCFKFLRNIDFKVFKAGYCENPLKFKCCEDPKDPSKHKRFNG